MRSEETTKKIPHRGPPFAETQRERILDLLRVAGPAGISRAALILDHHYTQCGARIDELKRQGFDIRSELLDGDRYATYVLRAEPTEAKPLPTHKQKRFRDPGGDWFVRQTGRPRRKPPQPHYGPLFEAVTR